MSLQDLSLVKNACTLITKKVIHGCASVLPFLFNAWFDSNLLEHSSNILKSNCSLSHLHVLFLLRKCMVARYVSITIKCLKTFGIYQSRNPIIPWHSYCSSGSKDVQLLCTFKKIAGQRVFQDIYQYFEFKYFNIKLFCHSYCSYGSRNVYCC
jgi:hypothetical protein